MDSYGVTEFAATMLGAATGSLAYIGAGVAAGAIVFAVVFGITKGIKALKKVAA